MEKKLKTIKTINKSNKVICMHDYKNAIKVGDVDYLCPLCGKLLDPFEWFFMNSFEFIEVNCSENKKVAKRGGNVAGRTRKDIERTTGRKVTSKENYLPINQGRKRIE